MPLAGVPGRPSFGRRGEWAIPGLAVFFPLFRLSALVDMKFFGFSRGLFRIAPMPSFNKGTGFSFLLLPLFFWLAGCGESPPPELSAPPEPAAVAPSLIDTPEPRPAMVFALQLGAFRKQQNAHRFFDRLEKKGLNPYMVSTEEDKPWFKVRLGPFSSQTEAQGYARKLKEEHGLKAVVLHQQEALVSAPPNAAPQAEEANFAPYETGGGAGENADAVVARFLVWIQAWQNIDIDAYLAFYSREFVAPGETREAWIKSRRKSLSRVRRVKVEVGEVRIREEGGTVEMIFVQNYWSDLRAEVSRKTLVWKKEDGEWKIVREATAPA